MASVIVPCVLIGMAALIARLLVRLTVPEANGPDVFFHLYMARAIRRNGHRIPATVERVTHSEAFTYPFLYHWLLSWIPTRQMRIGEMLTGPLADGMQALAAGLFAYAVLQHLAFDASVSGAIAVAALTASAPAFLTIGGGPRAYLGSPRPVGQLFFMIYVNAALLWGLTGDFVFLAVSVVGVVLTSVTSKFGNQAVLFISVLAGMLGAFWLPVISVIGAVAAVVIWRRAVLRVWWGQISHSTFYVRHLAAPYLDRAYGSLQPYPKRLVTALRTGRTHPHLLLDWIFADEQVLHRLVVHFPVGVVGLGLYIWMLTQAETGLSAELWPFVAILLASIALAVATSRRPLRFLGESFRYIEHTVSIQAILAVALLLSVAPQHLWTLVVLSLALGSLAVVSAICRLQWQYRPLAKIWSALGTAVEEVDAPTSRIHPLSGWFWPVLASTKRASVVYCGANCDIKRFGLEAWKALYGNFPRPGEAFDVLAANYGVTHAVGRPHDFEIYAEETGDQSFVDGTRDAIYDNGSVRLFAI